MYSTGELKDKFLKEEFIELLKDIYIDETILSCQNKRYIMAIKKFEKHFGEALVEIYSAPGRSEIGGNHTDHQRGKVLAASINLDAIAIVKKTEENVVKIVSDKRKMMTISLDNLTLESDEEGTTIAIVKGVLNGIKEKGYIIGGFNAYITSDVLIGAGLSSSAAFETLIGTIISGLYNDMKISAVDIAKIGQYAENMYFGKPCGLMDQMACSVGNLVYIDFRGMSANQDNKNIGNFNGREQDSKVIEDLKNANQDSKVIGNSESINQDNEDAGIIEEENQGIEIVECNLEKYGYSLCITDTKGSHADLTPDYAAVPYEMKTVAEYFDKEVLAEVDETEFYNNIAKVREKVNDRAVLRAIHFFEENKRVVKEVDALKTEDFDRFLEVVKASGNSSYKYLQNVYTNHDVQHQNVSLALAMSEIVLADDGGVCRVHGGGFAGTIQAFVKNDRVDSYRSTMESIFGKNSCKVLKIRKYGGMKVV